MIPAWRVRLPHPPVEKVRFLTPADVLIARIGAVLIVVAVCLMAVAVYQEIAT